MSADKEQAIIDAYKAGTDISVIQETLDTGSTSIYRVLKRNKGHQRKVPKKSVLSEAAAKYLAQQASTKGGNNPNNI